jgi:cell volume regulation protein A
MIVDIVPAVLIALLLMLVARPIAVTLSLLPFRFPAREVGFVSWVGLRGAVPIVLSLFPMMAGLESSDVLFNVTFVVVLFSLIVQGTTIPAAARFFKVQVPRADAPVDRLELALPAATVEIVQLNVERGASCVGRHPNALVREKHTTNATCVALVRGQHIEFPDAHTVFEPGDVAVLMLPVGAYERIAPLFTRLPERGPLSARRFFGEFVLDGTARVGDVLMLYGAGKVERAEEDLSIADLLHIRLARQLVVGDRIRLDRVTMTVREIQEGRVTRVGLKLADEEAE